MASGSYTHWQFQFPCIDLGAGDAVVDNLLYEGAYVGYMEKEFLSSQQSGQFFLHR